MIDANKKMSTPKAEVFFSDMTAAMQEDAVDRASQALMKYTTEYEMAKYIKSDFDAKYPAYWQCIIGNSPLSYFGNYEEKTTFTLLLVSTTLFYSKVHLSQHYKLQNFKDSQIESNVNTFRPSCNLHKMLQPIIVNLAFS